MPKKRIIPQMFDVRPVDETGDLDWKKITSVGVCEKQKNKEKTAPNQQSQENEYSTRAYYLGIGLESKSVPVFHEQFFSINNTFTEDTQKENSLIKVEEKLSEQEQKNKHREFQQQFQFEKEKTNRLERERFEKDLLEKRKLADLKRQQGIESEFRKKRQEQERILNDKLEQQRLKAATILAENEKRKMEKALWLEMEARSHREEQLTSEHIPKKEGFKMKKNKRTLTDIFAFLKSTKAKKTKFFDQETFRFGSLFSLDYFGVHFAWKKFVPAFVGILLFVSLGIGGLSFAGKGVGSTGRVLGVSQNGYANLVAAVEEMKVQNFEESAEQFSQAFENFSQASEYLDELGGRMLDGARFVPFASKVSSGRNAVEAGRHFSVAGGSINNVIRIFAELKNDKNKNLQREVSLLEIFKDAEHNIVIAKKELDEAQKNIDLISIDDLPEDKQQNFLMLKEKLPQLTSMMEMFLNNNHIFVDLLGGNGPRKYLFLFQNNSEMRATGGFIGSYGLLDISDGHIKKFFIDGIFNPDGQLKDKVVPPAPIQKISAAWSLHDSNWFADFPVSAQKAIQFYEKTGGPTADGVISFTPTLMQKLLKITGPIEMKEYGIILDCENFVELTQYKVEVDYDKQDNRPKKILSDLAPLLLEKLLNAENPESLIKTAQAFMEGLNEKHILLYSQDKELENIISSQGWSGEILPASRDYLSVINTNINGFKTDSVVEENIEHTAEIQSDGSVVDTVKISRRHNGGNSQYEWLNKVNADYMRIYVPKGSSLIEVSGQTREINNPPLDYDSLGFKRDLEVQKEEKSINIDKNSGTRIYEENEKTVFANWVYVSPQETVTITYKYLLPFRLFQLNVNNSKQVDSYSLIVQKQSGSVGSS
ncbi:MAG: DUF4012 domain-containing protein, partial [Candidatus Moranbacteria bacterium]|nr:DUF4012 domain-containing protein [Candidatus Moranbacteria bacterium]